MENVLYKIKKNINKSRKNFEKMNCHPKNKSFKKISCLDEVTVMLLKKIWNARHPYNKIKKKKKDTVWRDLKYKMSGSCNNEICWIDSILPKNNQKKKLINELFAPKTPSNWKTNPTEWLTSEELENVFKQYEEKYENFAFLGPSPIDFDSANSSYISYKNSENICVWPELCNFSLKKHINNGIQYIGMVFNLDKHTKGGSHWVSMYLDIPSKKMFYFDSTGNPAPPEINTLCKKIQNQGNKMNIKFSIDNNENIRHQIHNTECGMYCLYFIISLLTKKHNLDYFKKHIIRDKLVKRFRTIYFNKI